MTQKYPDDIIVPTKEIDEVWHFHILDTLKYGKDCEDIFGKFLHHFPYLGSRGSDDAELLFKSFEKTRRLYDSEFSDLSYDDGLVHCGNACNSGCGSRARLQITSERPTAS